MNNQGDICIALSVFCEYNHSCRIEWLAMHNHTYKNLITEPSYISNISTSPLQANKIINYFL